MCKRFIRNLRFIFKHHSLFYSHNLAPLINSVLILVFYAKVKAFYRTDNTVNQYNSILTDEL